MILILCLLKSTIFGCYPLGSNDISDYKETIMSYAETLKQQGMQQGKYEIVQEMLKAGVELSLIEKVSHLTKKEIEELKKSLH